MPHEIFYNSEARVIEIKLQVDMTLSEGKEIIFESLQMIKEKNCFFNLNDLREATVKLSTVEIYELPKIIMDIFTSARLSVYKLKRALVVARELEDSRFFETVSLNRGQSIKLFLILISKELVIWNITPPTQQNADGGYAPAQRLSAV